MKALCIYDKSMGFGPQLEETSKKTFSYRDIAIDISYGPMCHQRDRADVTEFVTLVRSSSLGQHVGVLGVGREINVGNPL